MWLKRQRVTEEDTAQERQRKELMNHTLLDRYPYFFKYRYPKAKKEYYLYENQKQIACKTMFGMTIRQLEALPRKTMLAKEWLRDYYEYAPLIDSESPMNMLCHYMESVDFELLRACRATEGFDWRVYIDPDVEYQADYEAIVECYQRHLRDMRFARDAQTEDESATEQYRTSVQRLREKMGYINMNPRVIANALVTYLFDDHPTVNKQLLWDAYGRYLCLAAQKNAGHEGVVSFPLPDAEGDIVYLGKRYAMKEVIVNG